MHAKAKCGNSSRWLECADFQVLIDRTAQFSLQISNSSWHHTHSIQRYRILARIPTTEKFLLSVSQNTVSGINLHHWRSNPGHCSKETRCFRSINLTTWFQTHYHSQCVLLRLSDLVLQPSRPNICTLFQNTSIRNLLWIGVLSVHAVITPSIPLFSNLSTTCLLFAVIQLADTLQYFSLS